MRRPGWYTDPIGPGMRWWDGNEWTGYDRPEAASDRRKRLISMAPWLLPGIAAVGLGITLLARG